MEERCSPMPVTLISAAGHAALFHYCAAMHAQRPSRGKTDREGSSGGMGGLSSRGETEGHWMLERRENRESVRGQRADGVGA